MSRFTQSLARFVCSDALDEPPTKALDTATIGFIDCVGVMIAAFKEPVTRNLRGHVGQIGGTPLSRIMLSHERATVAQATLIGVGAAHALDYDDYAYSNHVSALLVPAILAEAERTKASGHDMLTAYLAGMEVWGAIMKREPDHLHSKGWHPTGVFGPLGVAAALSRLRGLTPTQFTHALGLAVANGGGVMDNFGTQAKAYQGARAAEAGVVAVELALAGVDAGVDALDGSGGLMAALSPGDRVDRTSSADQLGEKWIAVTEGLNIKPHPTVGASQRAIDAAIQVQRDHHPDHKQIAGVVVTISEKHAAVMRFHQPRDALEAKFSLEFGVAAGLVAGRVGLNEVSDAFVARSDVQALISKVTLKVGPDNDPEYPVGAAFDEVLVEMKDGAVLQSEPVRRFRGHGMNPMTQAELHSKFEECVNPVLGAQAAQDLFQRLENLRQLENIHDLPVLSYP